MKYLNKKCNRYLVVVLFLVIFILVTFALNNNSNYSEIKPIYTLYDGCKWVKQSFPLNKISFYQQDCKSIFNVKDISFKEEKGKIYLNEDLIIEVVNKDLKDKPIDVVQRDWFSKLTNEEKNNCEIRNPEIKLPRGDVVDGLYKISHKDRYQIQIKKDVAEHFDDISDFDGVCEKRVDYENGGYYFENPFFEFDDRYPNKYLVVYSPVFLMEGPALYDLNTIIFE